MWLLEVFIIYSWKGGTFWIWQGTRTTRNSYEWFTFWLKHVQSHRKLIQSSSLADALLLFSLYPPDRTEALLSSCGETRWNLWKLNPPCLITPENWPKAPHQRRIIFQVQTLAIQGPVDLNIRIILKAIPALKLRATQQLYHRFIFPVYYYLYMTGHILILRGYTSS